MILGRKKRKRKKEKKGTSPGLKGVPCATFLSILSRISCTVLSEALNAENRFLPELKPPVRGCPVRYSISTRTRTQTKVRGIDEKRPTTDHCVYPRFIFVISISASQPFTFANVALTRISRYHFSVCCANGLLASNVKIGNGNEERGKMLSRFFTCIQRRGTSQKRHILLQHSTTNGPHGFHRSSFGQSRSLKIHRRSIQRGKRSWSKEFGMYRLQYRVEIFNFELVSEPKETESGCHRAIGDAKSALKETPKRIGLSSRITNLPGVDEFR